MMRRIRGFSLVEVFVVLAIVGLLVAILLPYLMRTMESSRKAVEEAGEVATTVVTPEPPTIEEVEEAAEKAADEHDIYDRVVALTENIRQLTIRVPKQAGVDSLGHTKVVLKYDGDLEAVQVLIDGKKVYDQTDEEIRTYLGMGKWEHLLDEVERKVAADREEKFRVEQERRFGPLPGWDSDG